jgi:sugar lactone lactonase YvrE
MVAVRGSFYVVEPNSSQLDRVDRNGQVSRIIDMSALQGNTWVGPTSVAYRGNFYVGNLTPFFPLKAGAAMIFKITPSGQLQVAARGLTAVLGVVFDEDGGLYALETSGGGVLPVPRTGRVVRVRESGAIETVATGLNFPTALTFGPDGSLYVSNQGYGFGAQAGQGQIVRIELSQEKDR